MLLLLLASLGACGPAGLPEIAGAVWNLETRGGIAELSLDQIQGCPPMSERVRVTWSGTELVPAVANGQTIHRPTSCDYRGCREPRDECLGYRWSTPPGVMLDPLLETDVILVSDGQSTLSATSRRPAGTFAWLDPPDGVVEQTASTVEFTVALTSDPENTAIPILSVVCEGAWSRAGENISFPMGSGAFQPPDRYRLELSSFAGPAPSPGVLHCPMNASTSLEIADCPAKRCALIRTSPLLSATAPVAQVSFDITVR